MPTLSVDDCRSGDGSLLPTFRHGDDDSLLYETPNSHVPHVAAFDPPSSAERTNASPLQRFVAEELWPEPWTDENQPSSPSHVGTESRRHASVNSVASSPPQQRSLCGSGQRLDVVCRLRPLSREEVSREWIGWRIFDPQVLSSLDRLPGRASNSKAHFRFDRVFGFSWSQSRMHRAIVEPRLHSVLDAEDSSYILTTIGTPHSGRRYVKMGDSKDGLWYKAAEMIFEAMELDAKRFPLTRVCVTMIGILSNKAVDLLSEAKRSGADLRLDPEADVGAERSTNASPFLAFNADGLMEIIQVGFDMAHQSGVPLLASCVTIHVAGRPRSKVAKSSKCLATVAKICLLDVAVPVPGVLEGDSSMISSLCELLHAVKINARYLPFRLSRLNTILSEVCVPQRATATVIVLVPSAASRFQESLTTLGFANVIMRRRETQSCQPILPESADGNLVDLIVERSLMVADRLSPLCQRWLAALEPQADDRKVASMIQQGQTVFYHLRHLAVVLSTGGMQALSAEELELTLDLLNEMIPIAADISSPFDLVDGGSKLVDAMTRVIQRIDGALHCGDRPYPYVL